MKLTLAAHTWSERHQVAAILAATGAIIVVLWVAVLGPLNLKRRALEREIQSMSGQLAEKNFLVGEEVLRDRQREEIERGHRWIEEWRDAVRRLALMESVDDEGDLRVGHIDFKVALYEARFRMNRKARSLGVQLPPNLGMEETVPSGEDARKLLYQLRSLEKLTDLALDLQVGAIRQLEPLSPIRHPVPDAEGVFLEEYPVRMLFEGDIGKLREWLRATLEPGRSFALRHLRVDGVPKGAPSVLRVTAVMSALIFPKNIEDLAGGSEERVLYTEPLGH